MAVCVWCTCKDSCAKVLGHTRRWRPTELELTEGRSEIEEVTVSGAKVASWEAHSDCQTVNYVSSEVGRGKIGTGLEWSHVPSYYVSGLATQQDRDGDGSGKGKEL